MTVLRSCLAFSAAFLPRTLYYNYHLHSKIPTYKLADVRKQIQRKSLERCAELTRLAAAFGIPACVENELVPFDRSDLIVDALSLYYPQLQFTFDVGHAIKAEVGHSGLKKNAGGWLEYLRRWIERCGTKILVAHVHDCAFTVGGVQDHLALGNGELDLETVFNLLKSTSCSYMLIETFWKNSKRKEMDYTELRRSVELCKSYF